MKRLLAYDSPVTQFLMKFCNACCLGLMWSIFSLPIFTAGAATTALYTVTLRLVQDREGTSSVAQFIKAFRGNFKQATQLWLMVLAMGAVLGVDGYIVWHLRAASTGTPAVFWTIVLALVIAAALLYAIVAVYLFPLLAYFDNDNLSMVKNAMMVGLRYLFCTISLLAIHFAMLWVVINLFAPLLLFAQGLCAFACSYLLVNVLTAISGEKEASEDEGE